MNPDEGSLEKPVDPNKGSLEKPEDPNDEGKKMDEARVPCLQHWLVLI